MSCVLRLRSYGTLALPAFVHVIVAQPRVICPYCGVLLAPLFAMTSDNVSGPSQLLAPSRC